MNYKVLYRKYRPDSFETLVGQNYTKKILKNSIINNKISHAYIFSGPRGTGKTSTARIFAKTVNCLDNSSGEACGKCYNCLNFADNVDIIEIDAASNNGVDQIREITNNIKLAPTMSKYKVYIIDEVHMLTESAFNALLLTLEEPPSHVIFILATTNIEAVPITILSRCQRFEFKKIKSSDIIERLQYVAKEEKIDIDDEAIKEIAYISDGGLRDSLSLLDQLSKDKDKITVEKVLDEVGSVSTKSIEKLLDLVEECNYQKIVETLDEYRSLALDYKNIIKKIIDVCTNRAKDIVINNQYKRLTYDNYKEIVFELADSLNKINVNIDSYSFIELILLKYVNFAKAGTVVRISKEETTEPEVVEEKKAKSTKKTSVKEENEVVDIDLVNIRINNCFVDATKPLKTQGIKKWNQFINEDIPNEIKGLVMDSSLELASDKIYVIVLDDLNVDEFNEKAEVISKLYKKIMKESIKFAGINKQIWEEKSNKFVSDKKSGIKYEYIEEGKPKRDKELENFAAKVFVSDKIEIE